MAIRKLLDTQNQLRALVALVCFFVCSHTVVNAEVLLSVKHDSGQLTITTNEGLVSIKALTEQSVYVWYQPEKITQLPSFALDPSLQSKVSTQLMKTDSGYRFELPNLAVLVHSDPMTIEYIFEDKSIVSEEVGLFYQDRLRGFRFSLDEQEKILGGGQRVLGMDRRGQRMPLYNRAHYGYTTESSQMYYSLPAIMSEQKYAIIFDNSASGYLDIGYTESNILQFEAIGGRTAYILAAEDNYPRLVEEIVTVTGKQPLPPRWALGNFASRFGYHSEQETLDTIRAFKNQDIPVDTVVLDLYWFGADIKGHMGNLNWDKNAWPQPEKMIAELRQQGIKTVVITEPFILTASSQWQSAVDSQALAKDANGKPKRFDFYFGNTGLVDVFNDAAQEWFWQYYEALAKQGIAGWWGDLGEPEVHPADSVHQWGNITLSGDEIHNAYGHQWAKMVYERQLALSPDNRPFVMMRSGFAGSQRYGMIPWTGDVSREWGGLKSQVELALQMSLFGLAYTHSDLGGFAGGEKFDPELYTRWLQFGVFTPVYRPHAQEHIAPEPVFHDDPVKSTVRDYIKLRYQLMPYIYSMAQENSRTGMPFMRPLFFYDHAATIANTDSYFFGDAFLVTPVTEPGISSVDVALPEGVWFNYWDKQKVNGGSEISVPTSLDQLPILVKAGSFVPMVPELNNLDDYSTTELNIHYYADESVKNASSEVFNDDGVSTKTIENKQYETITLTAQHGDSLTLNFSSTGNFMGMPKKRTVEWIIHGLSTPPKSIQVDGKAFDLNGPMVQWDASVNRLSVRLLAERSSELKIQ